MSIDSLSEGERPNGIGYRRASLAIALAAPVVCALIFFFADFGGRRVFKILSEAGFPAEDVATLIRDAEALGIDLDAALANGGDDVLRQRTAGGQLDEALFWLGWLARPNRDDPPADTAAHAKHALFDARWRARNGDAAGALGSIKRLADRASRTTNDAAYADRAAVVRLIAATPAMAPVRSLDPATFDFALVIAEVDFAAPLPAAVWDLQRVATDPHADPQEGLVVVEALVRQCAGAPPPDPRLLGKKLVETTSSLYRRMRAIEPRPTNIKTLDPNLGSTFNDLSYNAWEMGGSAPELALMSMESTLWREAHPEQIQGRGLALDTLGCLLRDEGYEEEAEAVLRRSVACFLAMGSSARGEAALTLARLKGEPPPQPEFEIASARGIVPPSGPADQDKANEYIQQVAPMPDNLERIEAELREAVATKTRPLKTTRALQTLRDDLLKAYAVPPRP